MIQRLNADQTRQIVRDLVPQGLVDFQIPEPVSADRVEEFCAGVAAQDFGRSYGWFDAGLVPRALLVGMVVRDAMTGLKHGLEHAWWAAPGWRGRPAIELLRRFEQDCKADGCVRVTFAFSQHVNPGRMQRLYEKLGYRTFSVSMSKEL